MSDFPEKGMDRPDPMAFGRGLARGLGVNLLVRDVEASARWCAAVMGARALHWEEHFAAMEVAGSIFQLHSDSSYRNHELRGAVEGITARGAGVELRVYGADPDAAAARAREMGALVLAAPADKPHGLREAHLVDPDGYVWVPSAALPE